MYIHIIPKYMAFYPACQMALNSDSGDATSFLYNKQALKFSEDPRSGLLTHTHTHTQTHTQKQREREKLTSRA